MISPLEFPKTLPNSKSGRFENQTDAGKAKMDVLKSPDLFTNPSVETHLDPQEKVALLQTTKMQVSTVADSVQQMRIIVDARAQTATWEIKQYFGKVTQALEARKKELLGEVDNIRLQQMRMLDQQFIRLNLLHQEVSNCEALQYGRGGDALSKLPDLNPAQWTDMNPKSLNTDFGITFSHESDALIKTIRGIGNVRLKVTDSKSDIISVQQNNNLEIINANKHYYQGIRITSKFGSRGNPPGKFNRPWDVAVGANIAVADRDNHCIQIFSMEGNLIRTFGIHGSAEGQFNSPMGIATNGNGEIIVADCYNHRVQVFSMDGEFVRSFGKRGSGLGEFMYPNDVAMTTDGNIPVADYANDRIQVFDPCGKFLYKFGVSTPSGVCVTSEGNIIVTDNTNNYIRIFSADGIPIRKFGGEGSGDGQFRCWTYCPLSATVDELDSIYVTDPDNHRVQIFSKDGTYLNQFGGDSNFSPFGVAVSAKGHIIVADGGSNCVKMYQRAESSLLSIAPT